MAAELLHNFIEKPRTYDAPLRAYVGAYLREMGMGDPAGIVCGYVLDDAFYDERHAAVIDWIFNKSKWPGRPCYLPRIHEHCGYAITRVWLGMSGMDDFALVEHDYGLKVTYFVGAITHPTTNSRKNINWLWANSYVKYVYPDVIPELITLAENTALV